METSYYLAFLLVPLLYFFTNQIIKRFQNLPPSPPLALPIFGHLHLIKKPGYRTLVEISNKYGPMLLLYFGSRPVLLVSSASVAEECFTKNDIVFANRPKLLPGKYFGYNYTTLVWASYGQHWRKLKRIATLEILSNSRIQMSANIRSDEVRFLIQKLLNLRASSTADEYGTVDMKSAFFELTLNYLMRMIAGKRYSCDDPHTMEEAKRFQDTIKEILKVSVSTNIADFVPLLNWIGQNIKFESSLKKLHGKRDKFMQDLIEERRRLVNSNSNVDSKNKTMIDVLLSLQETEPEYCTDEIIKGMIQVLLTGSDTTSGTMEWVLSILLNNPEALKRAQQEIDIQTGQSRLINDSDLSHLPYIHAVIKETLRMYPIAPVIGHHESSQECIVGGYRIPRGTLLLVNVWAMHNDPKVWEEPRKFKPERFMDSEKKNGFSFMPFGLGRRGCPGENLAIGLVGLTLGSLIQCFEWERPGKRLVDMSEGSGLTMPRAQPLLARCRPRQEMVKLLA